MLRTFRRNVRRYAASRALPAISARNREVRFDSLQRAPSPVLQLPDLSDQELAKVELPVGDEALNQGLHLVAIKPPERLARVERRLVQRIGAVIITAEASARSGE